MKQPLLSNRLSLVAVFIVLFASGCGSNSDLGVTPGADQSTPSDMGIVPTDMPEPTPTTAPPSFVLYLDPTGAADLIAQVRSLTAQFAAERGLEYVEVAGLASQSFPQNPRIAVLLTSDPGVNDLALAFPETQFIVIGTALPPTQNITTIAPSYNYNAVQGFAVGYLAAILTDEWRVGILTTSDAAGQQQRIGFVNGVRYFCGLCLSVYPPYGYPIYSESPPGSDSVGWQLAAGELIARSVKTVYVAPGAGDDPALLQFSSAGVQIIGASTPLQDVASSWVTSIHSNPVSVLSNTLIAVYENGAQGQITVPFGFVHTNFDLVSQARLNNLAEILDQIGQGIIDPVGE